MPNRHNIEKVGALSKEKAEYRRICLLDFIGFLQYRKNMGLQQEQENKTVRRQMIDFLFEAEMSAREISKAVGIREKEVALHLAHLDRTVAAQGKTLVIRPAQCLACGYVFKDRKRFTRPGRCPKCKGTHLESPTFRIQ